MYVTKYIWPRLKIKKSHLGGAQLSACGDPPKISRSVTNQTCFKQDIWPLKKKQT
jgi:hypothetical protein